MKKNTKSALILVVVFLFLATGYFAFYTTDKRLAPPEENPPGQGEEPFPEEDGTGSGETDPEENDDAWLDLEKNRSMAVIVDNDPKARPQAGLTDADVVYEVPVEGGTTRFLAFYSRQSSELIGPVRSARSYIIDIAGESDAVLVHAGGSPAAYARFGELDNLDGIEGGVDRAFWRTFDRDAPHNLYTDTASLRRVAREEGFSSDYSGPEFPWLVSGEEFSENKAGRISIDFGLDDFFAEYLYDEETEKYLRFTGGMQHWGADGIQLSAENIIIQMTDVEGRDSEGRLNLDLTDEGLAYYFCNGQVLKGFWKKEAGENTVFYRNIDEEVRITPGTTWVHVVPATNKINYY